MFGNVVWSSGFSLASSLMSHAHLCIKTNNIQAVQHHYLTSCTIPWSPILHVGTSCSYLGFVVCLSSPREGWGRFHSSLSHSWPGPDVSLPAQCGYSPPGLKRAPPSLLKITPAAKCACSPRSMTQMFLKRCPGFLSMPLKQWCVMCQILQLDCTILCRGKIKLAL